MLQLVERTRRAIEEREALRRRARESLPELVRVLVQDHGARLVIVFGSVVTGFQTDAPDIDLLVEGLPRERYAQALAHLTMIAPLPVDLVPAEWGRPAVVARAREEGEVLHAGR